MPVDSNVVEKFIKEAKEKGKGRNFRQSVDLILNLKEFDVKDQKNRIASDVVLPRGRGREVSICVIAGGDLALRAKEVGTGVLTKEDLEALGKDRKKVKELSRKYDFFVAQMDMMPHIGRSLGSVLGPRGKMPKPVPPNANIEAVVERLSKTITVRTQREQAIINSCIGSEEMSDKELAENLSAVVESVERNLPRGEDNIRSIIVKTSMGPPVRAL